MNALVPKAPDHMPLAYGEVERLAADMAQSGMFGFRTKAQAMTIMMISVAEGRHPALAARDYDIINGKPAKKAEAMMRDFVEAGGKMKWHSLTDEKADATFIHPQTGEVRIDWDMKRAAAAQLAGKENWKKYPRQMLRNRVVSEGIRTLWPLATSGMYVPDEVADFTGTTLEHTDEPEPDEREALNATVPLKAAAAGMQRAPRVTEKAPSPQRTEEQWKVWLDRLRDACAAVYHRSDIVEIANRSTVGDAIANGPVAVKREISAILAEHYARFPEEPDEASDELEIVGEEKMASGDD